MAPDSPHRPPAADPDRAVGRAPVAAFWRALTPGGWAVQRAEARQGHGQVALVDPEGRAHVLSWAPADPDRPALVRGRRLAFAYRAPADGSPAPVATYRALLLAAAAREDALASVEETSPSAAPTSSPPLIARENALWFALARKLPAARSVPAAVAGWLDRHLPAGAPRDLVLYLESPCRQACEFCELPQSQARFGFRGAQRLLELHRRTPFDLVGSGAFAALLRGLARRTPPPRLTLTGHDFCQHPRLGDLLGALEAHPGPRLALYGPGTRLSDPALAARVAHLPGLVSVGLTLESCDSAVHDAIVGAPGAGEAVQRAIAHLSRHGAPLVVTLVLSRRALPTLGRTVAWAAERDLSLTLQAVLPDRALRGAAALLPSTAAVHQALEALGPGDLPAVAALNGLPPCAVPPALRDRLRPPIPAPQREPLGHLPPCGACSARPRCPGVPASYARAFGPRGVTPIA